jgi:hypothetical protein
MAPRFGERERVNSAQLGSYHAEHRDDTNSSPWNRPPSYFQSSAAFLCTVVQTVTADEVHPDDVVELSRDPARDGQAHVALSSPGRIWKR